MMEQATFSDIFLSFNNVSFMSEPEIETFERLTKTWYETFFYQRSGRLLQSLTLDAWNMQTAIEVNEQKINLSEDDTLLVNKITYNQTIAYTAKSTNLGAKTYITLPFEDFNANTEYGGTLKSQMVAFLGLRSPLPIPKFETKTENEGEGSAIGILVGASVGVAALLLLVIVLCVGILVKKRRDDAGEGQRPPSAAGVIVYDGLGEALATRSVAAHAVLLASDNPTTLQRVSREGQKPSAGLLEPSPQQQGIGSPLQKPTAVSTPSDGYVVQFKDQARSVAPERPAQRDP